MKSILLICLLLFSYFVQAQVPTIQWQKCLGGSGLDSAVSIKKTFDGGYIVAGATSSTNGDIVGNHGCFDAWIVKLDSVGLIIWSKCFGGSGNDYASGILQTKDSCYVICGNTNSNDGDIIGYHGNQDSWVIKINKTGNIIWKRIIGGSQYDRLVSIAETKNGDLVAFGETNSSDGDLISKNGGPLWIIKLNNNGNTISNKFHSAYLSGSHGGYTPLKIISTLDSGYIFSHYTAWTTGAGSSLYENTYYTKVDKYDSIKEFSVHNNYPSIIETIDSNIIVGGLYRIGYPYYNYSIKKLNYTFNLSWDTSYNTTYTNNYHMKNDFLQSIVENQSGNITAAGNTYGKTLGDQNYNPIGSTSFHNHDSTGNTLDCWVLGINDNNGYLNWNIFIGGSDDDKLSEMQYITANSLIVAATTNSNDGDVSGNHGIADMWIVKLASTPLPIKFLFFNAQLQISNKVLLNWGTDNEINVSHFNIQRSINGKEFKTIGKTNSINASFYSFSDEDLPNTNIVYYRLQIIDKDGTNQYSSIQTIKINSKTGITVFPNPAKEKVILQGDFSKIKIADNFGKTVFAKIFDIKQTQIILDISQLTRGIYYIQCTGNYDIITEKLIVE